MFDILISKGIFTQDMIDEIKSSGTRRDQARQLVRDLETRGSQAFPAFIEILFETGQQNLADLLLAGDPQIRPLPIQPRPPVRPMPVDVPMDIKKPVDVYPTPSISLTPTPPGFPTQLDRPKTLIPSPSPDMDIGQPRSKERRDSILSYKMDASPCGHCLIINNKNLEVEQILQELLALSKMDHSQFDCCVVIMLSHGTKVKHIGFPGGVYGVDEGLSLPVQNITNYLDGKECPSLKGKPKLFFIQACGGENEDQAFEVPPSEGRCNMGGSDDKRLVIKPHSLHPVIYLCHTPPSQVTSHGETQRLVPGT
ncbi:hypothetical protein DPEC_G00012260 [Dallia pectoralis]|uniref:Uncharacterized protein n=1 Tax=Dallia pectoralis TaxID=75939 RepID=A0ACC2HMI2_DALPE|nr:hypothetical protein DPEC_G00012260 [Dallia pectoralis]